MKYSIWFVAAAMIISSALTAWFYTPRGPEKVGAEMGAACGAITTKAADMAACIFYVCDAIEGQLYKSACIKAVPSRIDGNVTDEDIAAAKAAAQKVICDDMLDPEATNKILADPCLEEQ